MKENRNLAYAEVLSQLIQKETVSAYGQTDLTKFYEFHKLLEGFFPKFFEKAEKEEFKGSLLFKLKGTDSSKNPVLFMSHHDVVEAPGEWKYPAFSGEIAEGKIWGRGTLDTKGNLWAILQAAEELLNDGFVPSRDIYFLTTRNEETNGDGANEISSTLQERGIRLDMVLDEGGMIVIDPIAGVKGKFAMIGLGEKGQADLKFTARSKGGHASTPGKNTPLVRLGKFMAEVEKSGIFVQEMPDAIYEMFRRMAPHMTGYMKTVFSNIGVLKKPVTKLLPAINSTAGAMVQTTLAFTMAQGSNGRNVLPQEAWVVGNMRFSHHQGREASIEAVKQLAAKFDIETEVLEPGFPSPITDFKGEAFKLVEKAIENVFPDVVASPYLMTAASDSRFLSRVCDNCIRFAPFTITNEQMGSVHGLNENLDVDTLAQAVDFFKFMMQEV